MNQLNELHGIIIQSEKRITKITIEREYIRKLFKSKLRATEEDIQNTDSEEMRKFWRESLKKTIEDKKEMELNYKCTAERILDDLRMVEREMRGLTLF